MIFDIYWYTKELIPPKDQKKKSLGKPSDYFFKERISGGVENIIKIKSEVQPVCVIRQTRFPCKLL